MLKCITLIIHVVGIFVLCRMGVAPMIGGPKAAPYTSPVFSAATLLDPNFSTLWISCDLEVEEDQKEVELEMVGKCTTKT